MLVQRKTHSRLKKLVPSATGLLFYHFIHAFLKLSMVSRFAVTVVSVGSLWSECTCLRYSLTVGRDFYLYFLGYSFTFMICACTFHSKVFMWLLYMPGWEAWLRKMHEKVRGASSICWRRRRRFFSFFLFFFPQRLTLTYNPGFLRSLSLPDHSVLDSLTCFWENDVKIVILFCRAQQSRVRQVFKCSRELTFSSVMIS